MHRSCVRQAPSHHLNLMETSFVLQRLSPYVSSPAARLVKSPKIYVSDSGLACYLSGIRNTEVLFEHNCRDAMLETYAMQQFRAIIEARLPTADLYFWHVQGRHEVDLVVEYNDAVFAFDINAVSKWSEKDLTSLKAFLASTPKCRCAVLAYNGMIPARLGDRLWALPLALLFS